MAIFFFLFLLLTLTNFGSSQNIIPDSLKTKEPETQIIYLRNNFKRPDSLLAETISDKQILNQNYQFLGEILEKELAFSSITEGETGRTATLRIHGGKPQHTKILINGIPFGTNSITDLNKIPVTEIERIEFSKHGNSAFYGSGTVSGWVNIVTKDYQTEKPVSKISFERGNYKFRNVDLLFGGRITQNFWANASGTISKSKGFTNTNPIAQKSNYEGQKVALNLLYDFNQDWYLRFWGIYNKTKLNFPDSLSAVKDANGNFFYDKNDYATKLSSRKYFTNFEDGYFLTLSTEGKFLKSTDDTFSSNFYFQNNSRNFDKDYAETKIKTLSQTDFETKKIGGKIAEGLEINELGYTERFFSQIGIDGEFVSQKFDRFPEDSSKVQKNTAQTLGFFFSNVTRLNKIFSFYGSLRREFFVANSKTKVGKGATFFFKTSPFEEEKFWMETGIANTFRNPTLTDLNFEGLNFSGNKSLKPETSSELWASLNYEKGIFKKIKLEYTDTVFRNSITYDSGKVFNDTTKTAFRGFELGFETKELYNFSAGIGGDYFFASDFRKLAFPKWNFKWKIGYKNEFFKGNLKVFANLNGQSFAESYRNAFDVESQTYSQTDFISPLNTVLNLNLRALIGPVELFYNFMNLGNIDYFKVAGYPELLLQTHWGIRWVFNN
ncbi:TonB-dependent receptor plug domain-containing protein [bacterium]|nr:TonB-dependent receptor plug domain-containing protein [bacterium]